MSARRLLAVCWDMPPMSGPRAVQVSRLTKYLVPLGWESSVVCFRPRSNRYNPDPELANRLRAAGVSLVPVASPEEHVLVRALWHVAPPLKLLPDEKWVWIRRATDAALRLARAERFDALVSFAQPWSDHIVGLRVHRATGLPWVAHFSDPWVDSPYLRGPAWQRRLWRRMEASVVREADALVFVNGQTQNRVMAKYPREWRGKAHVVPHGFDRVDTLDPTPRTDKRLRIVYTGRFYEGARTPVAMIRAIAALARRRPLAADLSVTFVGTIVPAYPALAAALGVDGIVEFRGRVSASESIAFARSADVLLVVDAPAEENLFLPSKLVDYLPLQKPILALTPESGATADLVRGLGYPVVAPDDADAIERALDGLLDAYGRDELGMSVDHARVAEQYDIRRCAAAFAEILTRCA